MHRNKIHKIWLSMALFFGMGLSFSNALLAQISINVLANDDDHLTINWEPLSAEDWAAARKNGTTILRRNLKTLEEIKVENIFPKDSAWFEQNRDLDRGFVYLIGKLLLDPELSGQEEADGWSNDDTKYHYILPEIRKNILVAEAVGLGFVDTLAIIGEVYTYFISFTGQDGTLVQDSITVYFDEDFRHQSNDTEPTEYQIPGGIPLSTFRADASQLNRLELDYKVYPDSVVLRWAPNNPIYWKATMKGGYGLFKEVPTYFEERDSMGWELVFLDSIFPWQLEQFADTPFTDSLVMVAAQCMYGEQKSTEEDGFMIQFAESNMRYGMAMLVADRSPLAATALGLRYVDKDVTPNEVYRYILLTRAAENIMENAIVEVFTKPDTADLVQGFYAIPHDGYIELTWTQLNDQFFSGFEIEKSENGGKDFEKLFDLPLIQIVNPYSRPDGQYQYMDSIAQNYVEYVYRIRGKDAFGDWSPYTTISTAGVDKTPPPVPVIYLAESTLEGKIMIQWEMPEASPDLASFTVLLSESVDGDYRVIGTDIPETVRSFEYPEQIDTERAYYFMLVAQDTAGNQSSTAPVYVHIVDSIAPDAPINLMGRIDSLGVVTVVWDHNTERDLFGYRVYMGNHREHEFAQLTVEPTSLNYWSDTIELKALDKEVFYKVVAVDRSFNHSPFSEILALRRPDIIPPAAPASLPSSSGLEGVLLEWMPSPSNDVVAYIIERREWADSTLFKRLVRIQDRNATQWLDTSAMPEIVYEYVVKAQDQSGLYSDYSFPVKGRRMFDLSLLELSSFSAAYRHEMAAVYLSWGKPGAFQVGYTSADLQYHIYKKKGEDGSWRKIRQLEGNSLSWLDRDIKEEESYMYGIKLVMMDGKSGRMMESETITILSK